MGSQCWVGWPGSKVPGATRSLRGTLASSQARCQGSSKEYVLSVYSVQRTMQGLNLCWQMKGDTESALVDLMV